MTGGPLGKKSHSSYRQKLNEEKQHNRILYTYFFTRHVVWFVKIQCLEVAKTRPWARGQQFVPVSSSTWPACMAKISNTSRANLFLFFIGKERTNMAAPWGAQIRFEKKKKYLFCINGNTATKWSQQTEILAHFLRFQDNLSPSLRASLKLRTRTKQSAATRCVDFRPI